MYISMHETSQMGVYPTGPYQDDTSGHKTGDFPLQVRLLGTLDVCYRGRKLAFPTRHAGFLVALLALEGPFLRETAAARLWGNREDPQARASLRQTIYHIQRVFSSVGAPALVVDRQTIALKEGTFQTDVATVLSDLKTDPVAAATQCDGELFGEVGLVDSQFQEWLDNERRALESKIAKRMEVASAACFKNKDWANLEIVATVRMNNDPYNEEALRHRMVAMAGLGKRAPALALFEEFRQMLRSTLDINPEPDTCGLREQIAAFEAGGQTVEESLKRDLTGKSCHSESGVTVLTVMQTVFIRHPDKDAECQFVTRDLIEEIVQNGLAQLEKDAGASVAEIIEFPRSVRSR